MLKHLAGLLGQSVNYDYTEISEREQQNSLLRESKCVVECKRLPLRATAFASTPAKASKEAARQYLVLSLAYYHGQILDAIVPSASHQFKNVNKGNSDSQFHTIREAAEDAQEDSLRIVEKPINTTSFSLKRKLDKL